MRKLTSKELEKILESHTKWLNNEPGGELADLRYAGLRGANLSGANLSEADLKDADLEGTALSKTRG